MKLTVALILSLLLVATILISGTDGNTVHNQL